MSRQRARAHARGPQHGARRDRLVAELDEVRAEIGHARAGPNLDAQRDELLLGLARQLLGEGRQDARAGLDQDDPGRLRIEAAKVARQRAPGDLGQRARQLHAGGAAADHDECGPGAPRLGGVSSSAASNARRIRRRTSSASPIVLSPGAWAAQWSCPKYADVTPVARIEVVVDQMAALEQDPPFLDLDALHARHEHGAVLLPPEQLADWRRNVGCRQRRGRDLIQERLEQMMIAPSTSVTRTPGTLSARVAIRPPKPPPRTTTWACCFLNMWLRQA